MKPKSILVIILTFVLTACQSKIYKNLYKSEPAFYSYIFGNVDDDKIISQHNPDVLTNVASCQKIITALLAYKVLGPEYVYQTKLYTLNKNGKIQDVIIEFQGDPSLTTQDLINLLEPIKNKKITGSIILNASKFQTPDHSPYIMISDVGSSYGQSVSAMIVDKNLVTITVKPTHNNMLADITIDNNHYQFNSKAITNDEISMISAEWDQDNKILITGNINAADNYFIRKLSPKSNDQYIIAKINTILKQLNIKGNIKITKNELDHTLALQKLKIHNSQPIKNIIQTAMKQSDNLVFDSLYLTIVNSVHDAPINKWHQGYSIIAELIEKHLDVNAKKIFMVDGSGLSRYNHITPSALFLILKNNYPNNYLIDALPCPGDKNSTLAGRKVLASNIIAKTGNMKSITCLCGYKLGKKTQVFVVTAHGFSKSRNNMHQIIDEFINQQL